MVSNHQEAEGFEDQGAIDVLRQSRVRLIGEVSHLIVNDEPVGQLAQSLAERLRVAFEADSCVVRELDGDELVLLGASGVPKERLAERMQTQAGLAKQMLQATKPVTVTNVYEDDRTAALARIKDEKHYAFRSFAGAPMLIRGKIVGLLGIYVVDREAVFDDESLEHLQILANQVATSVNNQRLYQRLQQQREQLAQMNQHLEAQVAQRTEYVLLLQKIGQAVYGANRFDEACQLAIDLMVERLGWSGGRYEPIDDAEAIQGKHLLEAVKQRQAKYIKERREFILPLTAKSVAGRNAEDIYGAIVFSGVDPTFGAQVDAFKRQATNEVLHSSDSDGMLTAGSENDVATQFAFLSQVIALLGRVRDRLQDLEQQSVLMRELNFRVRNSLSLTHAIINRSFIEGETPEDYRDALLTRVGSIKQIHELLGSNNWKGVSLRRMLEQILVPFMTDNVDSSRLEIIGDDFTLAAEPAFPLSLAIAELASNACKYGALSENQGYVRLNWQKVENQLIINWIESDGPAVVKPDKYGFGLNMIEQGIAYQASGETTLDFDESGLRCQMTIPLSD